MVVVWKDVKNYEGLYQVNEYGAVRSVERMTDCGAAGIRLTKAKELKSREDKDGYFLVDLYKNGERETCKVHRLVASEFLQNPNDYPIVHHKDENKQNNHFSNLEYCTVQYNTSFSLGKPVVGVHKETGEKIFFDSNRIAEKHGFRSSGISLCCNGKIKTHKGYIWSFQEGDADVVL